MQSRAQGQRRPRALPLSEFVTRGVPCSARWGRLDVTPTPIAQLTGTRTVTLTIHPPGTTSGQRRLLNLRQSLTAYYGWAVAFLGVLVAVFLGTQLGATERMSVAFAMAILAGTWLCVVWSTRRLASRARRVRLWVRQTRLPRRRLQTTVTGDQRKFESVTTLLDALDARTDLNPVAYELEWGRAYELSARSNGSQGGRGR